MTRTAFFTSVCTAALTMACAATMAQTPSQASSGGDARSRYEQERQKCMTHNTQDSLATCLREAGAARDAASKGQLSNPGPAANANARQRCAAFQNADEQAECVRRLDSTSSGSVSGGGVLRESTTTTIEQPR